MNEISPVAATMTASSECSLVSTVADIWQTLRAEARRAAEGEAMLARFLDLAVLEQDDLASALAGLLARKLAEPHMPVERLQDLVLTALRDDPAVLVATAADLAAVPPAWGWPW